MFPFVFFAVLFLFVNFCCFVVLTEQTNKEKASRQKQTQETTKINEEKQSTECDHLQR
jgi:large-conductance mechanosensitive channel